jgi:hypothetical protein
MLLSRCRVPGFESIVALVQSKIISLYAYVVSTAARITSVKLEYGSTAAAQAKHSGRQSISQSGSVSAANRAGLHSSHGIFEQSHVCHLGTHPSSAAAAGGTH